MFDSLVIVIPLPTVMALLEGLRVVCQNMSVLPGCIAQHHAARLLSSSAVLLRYRAPMEPPKGLEEGKMQTKTPGLRGLLHIYTSSLHCEPADVAGEAREPRSDLVEKASC